MAPNSILTYTSVTPLNLVANLDFLRATKGRIKARSVEGFIHLLMHGAGDSIAGAIHSDPLEGNS